MILVSLVEMIGKPATEDARGVYEDVRGMKAKDVRISKDNSLWGYSFK